MNTAGCPIAGGGWHLMGTARMGTDPARSVVNEWGRSHDVKTLFVVDGSIFVTSAGVNPTRTIQALALYVANTTKQRLAAATVRLRRPCCQRTVPILAVPRRDDPGQRRTRCAECRR
jgi:choline dehydrogenase-like flavoprotein